MKKIHYHTDCEFFAGCEKMLIYFFNSEILNNTFKVSFSYSNSKDYANKINFLLPKNINIYPLKNLYFEDVLFRNLSKYINIFIFRLIKLFFRPFNIIYQILIMIILFKKIKPDILHINNGGYPGALSCRAAVIAGKVLGIKKVIMVVNNTAIGYNKISRIFDIPIDLLVKNSTNLFITGSIASSIKIKNVLNLSSSKVITINNGLDVTKFNNHEVDHIVRILKDKLPNSKIFGVVALLEERKGHLFLFKAIKELCDKHNFNKYNFQILIEGWGILEEKLKLYINKNNLNECVKFVGVSDNINLFISSLDCLILPSIKFEDFPNVILEAFAYGKPVISTNIAGIPEQVTDGITGFLVNPNSVDDLVGVFLKINSQPSLLLDMKENCNNRYKTFYTSEIAINNYINLYSSLIKNSYNGKTSRFF